jgi:hypothetical protein
MPQTRSIAIRKKKLQFETMVIQRRGDFFPRTTRILQFSSEMQQT